MKTYLYYVFLLPLPPPQHLKGPPPRQGRDSYLLPGQFRRANEVPTLSLTEARSVETCEQQVFQERVGQTCRTVSSRPGGVCGGFLKDRHQDPDLITARCEHRVSGLEGNEVSCVPREL